MTAIDPCTAGLWNIESDKTCPVCGAPVDGECLGPAINRDVPRDVLVSVWNAAREGDGP